MAYRRSNGYRDNSFLARSVRGFVFKHYKPRSSYSKAECYYGRQKTRKAIRSGTFRGFSFRNGRNAPPL